MTERRFQRVSYFSSCKAITTDSYPKDKPQLTNDSVFKSELVKIIKTAFNTTDSDVLKEKILLLVIAFNVKSEFKKGLEGESLEFLKKYTP